MKVRGVVLRAMGLPEPYVDSQPLAVEELELDPPQRDELLIRVRAAGLCHSDLSVINGSRPRAMPMALGHEAAGEVVEVGPGAERFSPGDHVVLTFVPSCGLCAPCRSGAPALCEPGAAANTAGTLLSGERRIRDADGAPLNHHLGVSGFSEQIVVSANSAVAIDKSVPFELAAVFGCAVLTGVGAVVNSARVEPGQSVVVFGLGGVGLAALIGAIASGAATVLAVDVVPKKLELARELGATHAVAAGEDVVELVRELTNGGADHAIESVGDERALAQAYATTRRGGTTTTVGLPHPERMLHTPAVSLVTEERTLRGSYLGSCVPTRDLPRFIDLHLAGRLPVDRLLGQRVELDGLNQAFDRLASGDSLRQILVR